MTAEVIAATEPTLKELGVQIDLLERFGASYARESLERAIGPTHRRPPCKPLGMHPLIAKAIRDIADDEVTSLRLYGPHRTDSR